MSFEDFGFRDLDDVSIGDVEPSSGHRFRRNHLGRTRQRSLERHGNPSSDVAGGRGSRPIRVRCGQRRVEVVVHERGATTRKGPNLIKEGEGSMRFNQVVSAFIGMNSVCNGF